MLQGEPTATLEVTVSSFNGHPPLGVNATVAYDGVCRVFTSKFQWAPTLGGECYQNARRRVRRLRRERFKGHPPLGVNATQCDFLELLIDAQGFQWAPTLGGECYTNTRSVRHILCSSVVSMGTHPWG